MPLTFKAASDYADSHDLASRAHRGLVLCRLNVGKLLKAVTERGTLEATSQLVAERRAGLGAEYLTAAGRTSPSLISPTTVLAKPRTAR